MKKFLIALLALVFVTALQAQSFDAKKATAELTQVYSLDEAQQAEMATIQQRKARNLSEIQSLKTSDRETYVKKLKSIRYGTDVSIKKMLNQEQMTVFYEKSKERRMREADLMKKMKAEGATREQIQAALAEME